MVKCDSWASDGPNHLGLCTTTGFFEDFAKNCKDPSFTLATELVNVMKQVRSVMKGSSKFRDSQEPTTTRGAHVPRQSTTVLVPGGCHHHHRGVRMAMHSDTAVAHHSGCVQGSKLARLYSPDERSYLDVCGFRGDLGHRLSQVRDPHNMDYLPTRWPESPRIVVKCDSWASNGPNHLGFIGYRSWPGRSSRGRGSCSAGSQR